MSRTPPAWPRPDGGGAASAPTSRSPSGPPSRVGATPPRARFPPPSSAPPWGRSTGHRRTAASQAARATAPEARGAARSVRCRSADASHPGPRGHARCSGRATAQSSAGQSSSPPRHPRSCDPALTTRSPESAASRSDPGPTGASLPDRPRSDDQQPAPWLASAPHGAPAYPLRDRTGILNPSPSPGARIRRTLSSSSSQGRTASLLLGLAIASRDHDVLARPQIAHLKPTRPGELARDMSSGIFHEVQGLLVAGDDAEKRPGIVLRSEVSPESPALLALDVKGEFLAYHARLAGLAVAVVHSASQDNALARALPLAAHVRIAACFLGCGDRRSHEQPSRGC